MNFEHLIPKTTEFLIDLTKDRRMDFMFLDESKVFNHWLNVYVLHNDKNELRNRSVDYEDRTFKTFGVTVTKYGKPYTMWQLKACATEISLEISFSRNEVWQEGSHPY